MPTLPLNTLISGTMNPPKQALLYQFAGTAGTTIYLANFADNVLGDRPAPITIQDGVEALRVAVAATRACETGRAVDVRSIVAERT